MATINTSPYEPNQAVISVDTAGMSPTPTQTTTSNRDDLYKTRIPEPAGIDLDAEARAKAGQNTDPTTGTGVEGEVNVWQAHYSPRNFIGRISFLTVLALGWTALSIYTWGMGHSALVFLTWASLAVMVVLWISLGIRIVQAYLGHFYQLTNRRLFVSAGVMNRQRDMMELLTVHDVFTRQQSLWERMLGLGTVVVVPGEKNLPTFYLTGVNDPKQVMDLVWHHARAERDQRSLKVEDI